jgi:hypothetical protein
MSKTSKINQSNVNDLLKNAQQTGDLSAEALKVVKSIPNMGAKIKANLGISMKDVPASEVVIITKLVDDSGSIGAKNAPVVREGYNLVLEALNEAKQKNNILIATHYLNGTVLYPYVLLQDAIKMDTQNYNERNFGGTPLYDRTVEILSTVITKTQESVDDGTPARSITLIITDGADCHSMVHSASDVKVLVDDMLSKENHIIAAMGIDDGGSTDFRQVFKDMGIRDEWVLVPGNNPKEIREAFRMFSQSAVRASQTAGSFSKVSGNGFAG